VRFVAGLLLMNVTSSVYQCMFQKMIGFTNITAEHMVFNDVAYGSGNH